MGRRCRIFVFLFTRFPQERIGLEGPLFLAKRQGYPPYSMIVLNRITTENLIIPLTADSRCYANGESFLVLRAPSNDGECDLSHGT